MLMRSSFLVIMVVWYLRMFLVARAVTGKERTMKSSPASAEMPNTRKMR
jgi:hypothetical protein